MADNPVKRVLEDPAFKEAIKFLKEESINDFAQTHPADESGRNVAYNDLRAVGRLEARLQAFAENWEMRKRRI